MTAQRRSERCECGQRLTGWTLQTYFLAAFFIVLAAAVTLVAALSNPTSQLSVCCYTLCGVALLATVIGLVDRGK